MSSDVRCEYGVGVYGYAGDNSTLMDNGLYVPDNSKRRCIIMRSGHGTDGTGFGPAYGGSFFEHSRMLCDAGYTCLCIEASSINSWWNPNAITAVADAISYLQTRFGITKWAGFGGSMGGGVMIQALKTLSANCLGLATISGACDLDYFHGAGVSGYTPAYTLPAGSSFGGFTADMESAGAYNCTHAAWDTATAGHKIYNEYSTWHGLGVPIKMWQGDQDTIVPLTQAEAFIAGVDDPGVTLRVLPGAYHTPWAPGPGGGYGPPLYEYLDFFNSLAWT